MFLFVRYNPTSSPTIPPTMPLSDAAIRSLKLKEKSFKVSDVEGLLLTVKPTGSKLWHFKYRIDGKEKLLSIGRLRRGNTFEALALDFIAKEAKEGRAAATQTKTEWLVGMAIASFGKKPITEVTSAMILAGLRKVEAKGNYETAKRLRSRLGAVFRFAIAIGLAESDPTATLKGATIRPPVTPRAAITDRKKLGGLLRAIVACQGQTTIHILTQSDAGNETLRHDVGKPIVDTDLDANLGIARQKIGQNRQKYRIGGMVAAGQPNNACRLVAQLTQCGKLGVNFVQSWPQCRQQPRSGRRRGNAAGGARQQAQTDPRLQPGDDVAQGRLRQPKPNSGRGETALAGNCAESDKVRQGVPMHSCASFMGSCKLSWIIATGYKAY